jgi:hypothetical protein
MDANGRELRDQFRNSLLGLVEQPRMDANERELRDQFRNSHFRIYS